MFTSIAQIEDFARLTWSRFVNWHDSEGRNIACDMAQEICNRVTEDLVKGMEFN